MKNSFLPIAVRLICAARFPRNPQVSHRHRPVRQLPPIAAALFVLSALVACSPEDLAPQPATSSSDEVEYAAGSARFILDPEELQEAIAEANAGSGKSAHKIAVHYFFVGDANVENSAEEELKWLQKAADLGEFGAMPRLAQVLSEGGTPAACQKAKYWVDYWRRNAPPHHDQFDSVPEFQVEYAVKKHCP